jgi:hypothetical protein
VAEKQPLDPTHRNEAPTSLEAIVKGSTTVSVNDHPVMSAAKIEPIVPSVVIVPVNTAVGFAASGVNDRL